MTAKEYMNRAYRLDQRINAKLEQLKRLKSLSQRVTVSYGAEAVSRSRNVDTMADTVIRITEAENALNDQINKLLEVKKELRETIDLVASADCRTLLEFRYLGMKRWDDICGLMEMSRSNVFRLHSTALSMVETVLATKRKLTQ